MGITLQLADGTLLPAGGGPYQYTPAGYESLPVGSVPFSQWTGAGLSYEAIYRTQPWVAICINFLTRQVARLPLKTYEVDSQGVKQPVKSGPLYDLIGRPAPRCGPIHLKQWMTFPTLLHGNSTLVKQRTRAGGLVTGLMPAQWRDMEAYTIAGDDVDAWQIDYWISRLEGRRRVLQPDDVVHLAWTPPRGPVGVSPLEQLGVTVRSEVAAQRYQEATFRNSARPSGGVTLPESVAGDKELRRELRDDLERLHQGVDNTGRPVIMPPGSTWQQFGGTAQEAELISVRKLNREEAAATYNLPQPMVGILDHATYSNVVELHRMLYGPVLGPWLKLQEETFKAQVIDNEPAFEGQWVEYELREVLRGDPMKEARAMRDDLTDGLLTINEARQIRNLPKIDHPDCDRPMIAANNISFVGGGSTKQEFDGGAPAGGALARNLGRLEDRLVRRAKGGRGDGWDPDRFRRELTDDLAAADHADPERAAKAWTGAVTALVADSLDDPDLLRASFAALTPTPRED